MIKHRTLKEKGLERGMGMQVGQRKRQRELIYTYEYSYPLNEELIKGYVHKTIPYPRLKFVSRCISKLDMGWAGLEDLKDLELGV